MRRARCDALRISSSTCPSASPRPRQTSPVLTLYSSRQRDSTTTVLQTFGVQNSKLQVAEIKCRKASSVSAGRQPYIQGSIVHEFPFKGELINYDSLVPGLHTLLTEVKALTVLDKVTHLDRATAHTRNKEEGEIRRPSASHQHPRFHKDPTSFGMDGT